MIKAKKQKNLVSLTLLGWLFIPCWAIFVSVTTHANFITQALGGLATENSTLITTLILLIPSALVAIPMTYHPRFSSYLKEEDAKTSSWIARAIISLFMTTVILFFVWYMFIVLSFIFY